MAKRSLSALLAGALLAVLACTAEAQQFPNNYVFDNTQGGGGAGLAVGTAPITGTCTSGNFLYNNSGILGCSGSSSSIAFPQAVTGGVSGGIPYFSSTTALSASALLTNHALVLGGGAGNPPTVLSSLGTSTTLLHGASAGAPTFGAVSLTADVSGTLPVANGGTGITSLGTGVATWLGTPSSANFFSAITDETGSGAVVGATSPTLVTPTLGAATATSLNGNTFTAGTGTLTFGSGKTLTASNTLTFTGTDGSSVAFGTGGTTAYIGGTLAQFAATTSSQLAGVLSDETGTGAAVFANTPTLVTPVLGAATATTINGVTVPSTTDTTALLGTAQTFTKAQRGTPVTVSISTATFTPDFSLGNNFVITLVHASCPCTLANPTNITAGQSGTIQIIQSSTGSDLITTYGGDWKFPGATKPTYTTTASHVDTLSYYVPDSTHIQTNTFGLDFQ